MLVEGGDYQPINDLYLMSTSDLEWSLKDIYFLWQSCQTQKNSAVTILLSLYWPPQLYYTPIFHTYTFYTLTSYYILYYWSLWFNSESVILNIHRFMYKPGGRYLSMSLTVNIRLLKSMDIFNKIKIYI